MPRLSGHLSLELMERGKLPISPEGIVRLRPDIAGQVKEAQSLLSGVSDPSSQGLDGQKSERSEEDVLIARFRALPEGIEQNHLFLLEKPESDGDNSRLRRWSKMSVSYGTFVQISKFLNEAWGEIRGLEIQKAQLTVVQQLDA